MLWTGGFQQEDKHTRLMHRLMLPLTIVLMLLTGFFFSTAAHADPSKNGDDLAKYQSAADKGDAYAQSMIGSIYLNGTDGVQQDYKRALFWLTKAADQGEADAQYDLGVMYQDGMGTERDFIKAVEWYKKAAGHGFEAAKIDTGVAKALLNLGVLYRRGEGVKKDLTKAYMLYSLSAATGNSMAEHNRRNLEKILPAAQKLEAEIMGQQWKTGFYTFD